MRLGSSVHLRFLRTATIAIFVCANLLIGAHELGAQEAKFSFTEGYYQPSATTGPQFPSWSPDGKQLAFAMEGSIWTVGVNGGEATQVTSGPTYDSQPQWSPDGKSILYDSDFGATTELFVVDLDTHQTKQLTHFGRVTLDPRWSPDGKMIAFTSGSTGTWSAGGNYFNLYVMPAEGGEARALVESRDSSGQQAFGGNSENIEPTFSADGKSILYLARKQPPDGEVVIGSGWLWEIPVAGGEPKLIRREETIYQTRPAISPDGSRIAYITMRRGKNELAILPVRGGEPIPITYVPGKIEQFEPAWSPDSRQITFVDNSDGTHTALWIIGADGGVAKRVEIKNRKYAYPVGQVKVTIANPDGDAGARIYVTASNGKAYFPLNSIHREHSATGDHYTFVEGEFTVTLPAGKATIEAMKGFEYMPVKTAVEVRANQTTTTTLTLHRFVNMAAAGWWSGDDQVHGDYGGMINITPEVLAFMGRAEDVNVIDDLICNRDNRMFDIPYFEGKPNEKVSRPNRIVYYNQEYRPGFYGHMNMLGLKHLIVPFYNGERGTAWGPNFPTNSDALDMAHAAGAYGGPVHMINAAEEPSESNHFSTGPHELPVEIALGKADWVEILSMWSNHTSNYKLWYRWLNVGFHVPITAGTDSFPNFDRNPAVGGGRVYTHVGPQRTHDGFLKALRGGRSFVTSGPLLQFTVDGHEAGDTVELPAAGKATVTVHARVDSIFPMTTLTLIRNGQTVATLDLSNVQPGGHAELTKQVEIPESGWLAVRVDGDGKPHHGVMKSAVYAHSGAIYVRRGFSPTRSAVDAQYFVHWIGTAIAELKNLKDWNSPSDQQHAVDVYEKGLQVYTKMLSEPNVSANSSGAAK